MDEDLKLYIPLGVKPEAELFTGFGKKQLFQALIGSLLMGGVAALVWLFTANVTTTVVLALAGSRPQHRPAGLGWPHPPNHGGVGGRGHPVPRQRHEPWRHRPQTGGAGDAVPKAAGKGGG